MLHNCKEALGDRVTFVPFKLTAVASPQLLEELTGLIVADPNYTTADVDPRAALGQLLNANPFRVPDCVWGDAC